MGTVDSPSRAAARLRRYCQAHPTLAVVLGSGFHHVLESLEITVRVPYSGVPGFPPVGVAGHGGEVVFGTLGGVPVIILSGRAHFYEGHDMQRVTFPVRTLAALGVTDLLLTNAAGGISRSFKPGDFMVLTDHINFMGANPLRGPLTPELPRFVDLTTTYDPKLRQILA
ncbi:MAG TPA: purine-nucleoside phosphorylase, partial [Clostridia bacterium]|nr:purine-nucleoside phosphorylase [Clostridia bacterium]